MKLCGLKFVVKNVNKLTKKEINFVMDIYHELFIKIYGYDVVDAFNCVTKTNIKDLVDKDSQVKALAKNYQRVSEVLTLLEDNPNIDLLLIYLNEDDLVGSAILERLDDDRATVLFIALNKLDKEKYIWKETVRYIENYFKNNGYKKMYLEIPLKEGHLLLRARELGFEENPKDIIVDEEVYTYILNKKIEG